MQIPYVTEMLDINFDLITYYKNVTKKRLLLKYKREAMKRTVMTTTDFVK
jgi:hypothetical protein